MVSSRAMAQAARAETGQGHPARRGGLDRGRVRRAGRWRDRRGARRAARQGARHHQGQLLLALRRPPRPARRDARAWTEGRIAAIREQATARGAPAAVLRDLADLYTRNANARGLAIELAIRSLARTDEAAAKAVRSVDRERLQPCRRAVRARSAGRAATRRRAPSCSTAICSGRACSTRKVGAGGGARQSDPRAHRAP